MSHKQTLAEFLADCLIEKGYVDGEYYTDEEWRAEITPFLEEGIKEYENNLDTEQSDSGVAEGS